jgi:hypothetical protein
MCQIQEKVLWGVDPFCLHGSPCSFTGSFNARLRKLFAEIGIPGSDREANRNASRNDERLLDIIGRAALLIASSKSITSI